jgi:hypothetical protein
MKKDPDGTVMAASSFLWRVIFAGTDQTIKRADKQIKLLSPLRPERAQRRGPARVFLPGRASSNKRCESVESVDVVTVVLFPE